MDISASDTIRIYQNKVFLTDQEQMINYQYLLLIFLGRSKMIAANQFKFPLTITIQKDFHLKLQELFKLYGFQIPSNRIPQAQYYLYSQSDVYYKDLKRFIEQLPYLAAKKYQNIVQIAKNTLFQAGWIPKKNVGMQELMDRYGAFMLFAKQSHRIQQRCSQMVYLLRKFKSSEKEKMQATESQIQLSNLQREDKTVLKDLLKTIQQQKDSKQIIQVLQSLKVHSPATVANHFVPRMANKQLMEHMKNYVQYLGQNFIDYKRADSKLVRLIKAMSSASENWMETSIYQSLSTGQQQFIQPLLNYIRQLRQKIMMFERERKQLPDKHNYIQINYRKEIEKKQGQLSQSLENNRRLASQITYLNSQVQRLNNSIRRIKQDQQAERRQAQKKKQNRVNTAIIRPARSDEQLRKSEQSRKLAQQLEQMRNKFNKTSKELIQLQQYIKFQQKQKAELRQKPNARMTPERQTLNQRQRIQPKSTDVIGRRFKCIIDMLNQLLNAKAADLDLFMDNLYAQKNLSESDKILLVSISSLKTNYQQLLQKHQKLCRRQKVSPQKKAKDQQLQQAQQTINRLKSEINQLKVLHRKIEVYERQLSHVKLDKQKLNEEIRKLKEQLKKLKNQPIIQPNEPVELLNQDNNDYQQRISALRINQRQLKKNYSQLQKLYNSEKRQTQRLLLLTKEHQKLGDRLSQMRQDYQNLQQKYELLSKAKQIESTMAGQTSSQTQKSLDYIPSDDYSQQLSKLREEIRMKQATIKAISVKFQELIAKKEQKISSLQICLWEVQSKLNKDQTLNRIRLIK